MRKIASSIKYKKAGAGSGVGAWGKLQEQKWVYFCEDTANTVSSCLTGDEITPCLTKTINESNPKTAKYVGNIDSVNTIRMGTLKRYIERALEEAGLLINEANHHSKTLTGRILDKHNIDYDKEALWQ